MRIRFTWLKLFFLLFAFLGCLGILVSSRASESEYYYFVRQSCWFLLSALALFAVEQLEINLDTRKALLLFAASLCLLLAALLFGVRINSMRGWFRFHGIGFQPAELLKPVFIICMAQLMSSKKYAPESNYGYIVLLMLLATWLTLLFLQPDAGTALIYALVFFSMLWIAGLSYKQLAAGLLGCILAASLALWQHPYMLKRLEAFFKTNPQSMHTVGWHASAMSKSLQNGGWFGKLFSDDPYMVRVPYRNNDSIFAALSEQLGFVGMLPLILLSYCWLAYCCIKASRCEERYEQLLYIGCGVMLSSQAFLHLAVNLNLFPTTGITFPLISYGGSSLMASMLVAAIVDKLNIQATKQ
ncbi:MAG: FtsW/RodA/SpoVE family cell cycle protein [Oligosphaeraceae bacterium]|nr:FtsW/RodA/SpoVE family cell cycle protein [Oligosphaeraceae bacterium]